MAFERSENLDRSISPTAGDTGTMLRPSNQEMKAFYSISAKNALSEPASLNFGNGEDLYGKTDLVAQMPKLHNQPQLISDTITINQELRSNDHHWKIPGQDDDYKGWKPGDKFAPKDFDNWRESVRTYVSEFMRLNHIDKNTPDGESFRNAFQHELAAAAFLKQTNSPGFVVDAVGVGQEIYQAGKDILGIYGGTSMVEAGGRGGNKQLIKDGRKALTENANRLATMFPSDTPNDIANNHKGAELALSTNLWDNLLRKVADSAAEAPMHNGVGQ